ncbi:CHASE2 domain-containing protein [Nitrincola nitratireducens]|uniref:Adenylate cyclase 1 n=1 Tax=Nitrincola nitratireducens TaxID=1229521 RepID=W9UXV7_9GAMM|nr:adenylate/guanylate cyclase domain-containing protein [Nitrincola nitratireducens]EXJ11889.1 Adenylate cyclase 1 [Nitrincola nitratireducens]
MRQIKLHIALSFTLLCIFSALQLYPPQILKTFELKLSDQMLSIRGQQPVDPRIAIIDIDERSLQEIGQWPWPRNRVAELLLNLRDSGVAIIGLDIVFAEPDNASPRRILQNLNLPLDIDALPDYDEIFNQAIVETPTVLGYVFVMENDQLHSEHRPDTHAIILESNKPPQSLVLNPHRPILSLPQTHIDGLFSGYINTLPDIDGTIRHLPLIMEYDGNLYPSLAMEIARLGMGAQRIQLRYHHQFVETLLLDSLEIPTDIYGRLAVNFRGPSFQYPYISAVDVLTRPETLSLEGSVVLVGTSAAGLLDLRSTPLDSVYPGVEVHATVIDNILNQDFISKPSWALGVDFVTLCIIATAGALILSVSSTLISACLALSSLMCLLVSHYYLLSQQGLLFTTLTPSLLLISHFVLGTLLNHHQDQKQKNFIRQRFERKVSKDIVNELLTHPNLMLEGSERYITIFFSDIRGFTQLSESIGSARQLVTLLNRYMSCMIDRITHKNGTIDKLIGDAIMAYWNAPMDDALHADHALSSAIEQIEALQQLNADFIKEGLPMLSIGIGLNTGMAIVGEMGSEDRSDYTCIGDEVNLASRTEGLCKYFQSQLILTESTYGELQQRDLYHFRPLGLLNVKGKSHPVRFYECLGLRSQPWCNYSENEDAQLNKALEAFQAGHFQQALTLFRRLDECFSQHLYQLYVQHCLDAIRNPPTDFNGTLTMTEK